MSKVRKVLADILSGRSDSNIAFSDLCHLLERGGLVRRQGSGSHVIFHREGADEILNVQPLGSKAKAYQVKQVRNLILKYQLDIN
jgi:virulence-associated protein VapD